ncbi:MAG: hypothetical protein WCP17_01455 [bacterium]
MINQQLIIYIKKEMQRGVPLENIKNVLLSAGWKITDINEAFNNLSSGVVTKSKFNKKFIFVPLVILLLIVGGFFAYKFYISIPKTDIPPVAETPSVLPTNETPPSLEVPQPSTTGPVNAPSQNIYKVATVIGDICQGFISGDNSLIIKHASIQTINILATLKTIPVSSCIVNNIQELDTRMVANMTMTPIATIKTPVGVPYVENIVFINENGDWKYDLTASLKFAMDDAKAKVGTGDINGFVDLVVTNVVVTPPHPIVNNKDIQVVITIKNIGTKTSDTGAPFSAELAGFKNSVPFSGGNYGPLAPGGTVDWTWSPYKENEFFKLSDTAGQKTIKIDVNFAKSINESNYANNIYTKPIEMFAK